MASEGDENALERYKEATGEERINIFLDTGPTGAVTRPANPKVLNHPLRHRSPRASPI